MLCVPVVVAAFPVSLEWEASMGWEGWVRPPSIESVRCCGIAVNLQETALLVATCSVVLQLYRALVRISVSVPVETSDAGVLFRTSRAL